MKLVATRKFGMRVEKVTSQWRLGGTVPALATCLFRRMPGKIKG
jgi:hypothetical protein